MVACVALQIKLASRSVRLSLSAFQLGRSGKPKSFDYVGEDRIDFGAYRVKGALDRRNRVCDQIVTQRVSVCWRVAWIGNRVRGGRVRNVRLLTLGRFGEKPDPCSIRFKAIRPIGDYRGSCCRSADAVSRGSSMADYWVRCCRGFSK
jgi:hypothetical protein